ncbi:MAG: hypothetical protein H6711_35195 [Myxococcales bacterium]|nr:hypothetical protein [Myxococcales bacterium]
MIDKQTMTYLKALAATIDDTRRRHDKVMAPYQAKLDVLQRALLSELTGLPSAPGGLADRAALFGAVAPQRPSSPPTSAAPPPAPATSQQETSLAEREAAILRRELELLQREKALLERQLAAAQTSRSEPSPAPVPPPRRSSPPKRHRRSRSKKPRPAVETATLLTDTKRVQHRQATEVPDPTQAPDGYDPLGQALHATEHGDFATARAHFASLEALARQHWDGTCNQPLVTSALLVALTGHAESLHALGDLPTAHTKSSEATALAFAIFQQHPTEQALLDVAGAARIRAATSSALGHPAEAAALMDAATALLAENGELLSVIAEIPANRVS